jgi:hypothetical protein
MYLSDGNGASEKRVKMLDTQDIEDSAAKTSAPEWSTVCGKCKTVYTLPTWLELPCIGVQPMTDGQKPDKLELRNCPCGSTLGRWV